MKDARLLICATTLLLAGCASKNNPVEPVCLKEAAGQPLFKHFEKNQVLIRNDQLECMQIFSPENDKVDVDRHMLQLNVNSGVSLEPRVTTDSEVLYVAKGSGMIKINSVAYVLQEHSGIYIPKGSKVEIINNSKQPMKCLVIVKSLAGINSETLKNPMTFVNTPKVKDSELYKQVVDDKPLKIETSIPTKVEVLTPDENINKPVTTDSFK